MYHLFLTFDRFIRQFKLCYLENSFFFLVCIIWRGFITIFLHLDHIYTHLTHYRPIADQISYPPINAFTHVDSKDIHPFITTRVHLGCGGMGSNMWLLRCSISHFFFYSWLSMTSEGGDFPNMVICCLLVAANQKKGSLKGVELRQRTQYKLNKDYFWTISQIKLTFFLGFFFFALWYKYP